MTAYFETATTSTDLLLLPDTLRAHRDLATVAAQAEADVIEQFTRRSPVRFSDLRYGFSATVTDADAGTPYDLGNGQAVYIDTYDPDASAATVDAGMKRALKATIADVIAWRLKKIGEAGDILSSVGGNAGASKQFRDHFASAFPPGRWTFRMKRWDIRPELYSV